MKKYIILASAALLLFSCSENPIEKALKDYVIEGSKELADENKLDYKLISYAVTDTITNAEFLDSLKYELEDAFVWENPTKDSLLSFKDTKFPDYFMKDIDAHAKISSFYSSIDSLINVWDDVTPYSYELNLVPHDILLAQMVVYGIEPTHHFEEHYNNMVDKEHIYRQADSIYKEKPDEIYAYKVTHNYSINNILLGKRTNISHEVLLNKELKVISTKILNSMEDMMKQITE